MSYFRELGRLLESRWSACDRDEERFPDLAAEALREMPPARVEVDAIVDAILDPASPATRQLAPLGAFGQPGITMHYGQGFVIDVYFWTQALSAIHNHPFCGVFTVLDGFSVHARYRFEPREVLSPRMSLGDVRQTHLTRVEPGAVERFSHRDHPLIHALLHVPIPTVSMVVRTVRTLGYLRYFPPTLALAMDEPDATVGRALTLLDTLRAGGDRRWGERLEAFLASADLETTVRCLSRLWPSLGGAERAALVSIARTRHGDRAAQIAPALERALTTHEGDAMRAMLHEPDDRFVATGLAVAESREALLSLLKSVHDKPLERLHRFVDDAGVFTPEEAASAHLAHALIDGVSLPEARARLVERYDEESVAPQREAIEHYWTRSPFACLGT